MYKIKNNTTEGGLIVLLLFQVLFFLGHVLAHGSKLDWTLIYSYSDSIENAYLFLMYLLCRIGSIGYLVGLGYFGIKYPTKTLLLFMISSLVYTFAAQLCFSGIEIKALITGSFNYFHTAPLFMAIVLSPLLSLNDKEKAEVYRLMIVVLFYYFIYRLALNRNDHTADINIIYFMIGVFSQRTSAIIKKKLVKFSLISIALLIILGFTIPNSFICYLANYNNIIYVLISVGLCIMASELFGKKGVVLNFLVNEKGLPYIGIYLLTDSQLFIKYGYPYLLSLYLDNILLGIVGSLLTIVVLFGFNRLLTLFLSKTFDLIFTEQHY